MLNTKKLDYFEKRIVFQDLHFNQIRLRRIIAGIIDVTIISLFCLFLYWTIYLVSIKEIDLLNIFFLNWMLYYGSQLSGKSRTTIGMRIGKIRILDKHGRELRPFHIQKPFDILKPLALPYITIVGLLPVWWFYEAIQKGGIFSNLVLLSTFILYFITFMNQHKRSYQDILSGITFIRSDLNFSDPI